MLPKLFDVSNGVVKPSEHCYTISFLKDIMEVFPDEYMKIYAFIYYMTCTDAEQNPFFNLKEDEKEEFIYNAVDGNFSLEEPLIVEALDRCKKLNETAAYRAFKGVKAVLDKLAVYFEDTPISHGRDGNITAIVNTAAKFFQVKDSFDRLYEDLKKEQKVRGGKDIAYDQRGKTMSEDDAFEEN